MPFLSVDSYNNIKEYVHPNLHKIIKEDNLIDDKLICLPQYHGCDYRNKNGTNKLIDYARWCRCILPTWKDTWRRNVKSKYFNSKYPRTRYLLNSKYRNLFKNKGNYVYNYSQKTYKSIKEPALKEFFNKIKQFKDVLCKKA